MIFEHDVKRGTVKIGDIELSILMFTRYEPGYAWPEDMLYRKYDPRTGQTIRNTNRQFKIEGRWIDGDRYISRQSEFINLLTQEGVEEMDSMRLVETVKSKRKRKKNGD